MAMGPARRAIASWLGAHQGVRDPAQRVPRTRDHARRVEPRSRRLHVVPWRVGRARDRDAGGLRHVPRCRAEVRARRPPALGGLPRAAHPTAHARVHYLPREDDRRAAHDDPGWLRDVPSPARPGRPCGSAGLQDLPRSGHAAGASPGSRPRRVRELPRVAPPAAARRPSGMHWHLPRRQARSPARRKDLHRMPRVSPMRRRRRHSRLLGPRSAGRRMPARDQLRRRALLATSARSRLEPGCDGTGSDGSDGRQIAPESPTWVPFGCRSVKRASRPVGSRARGR
jgi:hypothetical protein